MAFAHRRPKGTGSVVERYGRLPRFDARGPGGEYIGTYRSRYEATRELDKWLAKQQSGQSRQAS